MAKLTGGSRSRTDQTLEKYLQEIGEVPLLSAEEEIDLAKRIKKGDQDALEKLTKANLRFVVSVAKQYQNQGPSLGDLINEGNLGLIKAANRFDETRGFKFISYAVWWIRQSILQALAEQSRVVRLPLNRVGAINKVGRALEEVRRVLRTDGRLLFCEHGAAPDEPVLRWQNRVNPVWRRISGGCNLNRAIPSLLESGGFRISELSTMYIPGLKVASFNYWGSAKLASR